MTVSSPIFVMGTPRSGTTLLAKILGRHPSLFMPGETHFFPDIYSRRNELGGLGNVASVDRVFERLLSLYARYNEPSDQIRIDHLLDENGIFTQTLKKCSSYRELFSTFMQLQAAYEGKERWGNNVPRDIFHVDEIINFFPDAKIIVCVRDVRAFLLSYQGKWKITAEDQVERLRKLYHPVVTSLLWKSSMRLIPGIRKNVRKENLKIVPYEELVQRPEAVVRNVCLLLGEEFESSMLDITSNNSSHEISSRGIFKVSVSKWKTDLSPEEIWISQKIAPEELRYINYAIEPVKPNPFKVFWIILCSPFALLRAIKANKETSGPLIPYLAKRIRFLFSRS